MECQVALLVLTKLSAFSYGRLQFVYNGARLWSCQVVSLLSFHSDYPSWNPTDAYSFFFKICVGK